MYGNKSVIVKKVDIEIEGQKYKDVIEIRIDDEYYPSWTTYLSMCRLFMPSKLIQ